MNIRLSEPHLEWLQSRVADGTFTSVDEAIARIVEERMALEESDLDWAREEVAAARADIADGRIMSIDEHRSRNAERRKKLSG